MEIPKNTSIENNQIFQDQTTLDLEELLNSTKITTEERVKIRQEYNKEKKSQLENTRKSIDLKLSEKQLSDFKT